MNVDKLNKYLAKLEGDGLFQSLNTKTDTLILKMCGSVGGPYDDGEIELIFSEVEIVNLPLSMMLPVKFSIANQKTVAKVVSGNNQWENRSLFYLKDDDGCEWYIYAGSYEVKLLPIFWKRP